MRFKEIQFIDRNAQRVYRNYIQSIKNETKQLCAEDSLEILMEFNSHLYESVQIKNSKSEIDNLLNAIDKLGTPEEVLKPLVADKMLDKATRSFKPIDIFKALYLNIGNGISYIIFALLYSLVCFILFITFLKLIFFDITGLFIGDDVFLLGTNFRDGTLIGICLDFSDKGDFTKIDGATDVLGNWFIPVMLLLNIALYFIVTMALKFKRSINIKYKR